MDKFPASNLGVHIDPRDEGSGLVLVPAAGVLQTERTHGGEGSG